jgi:hypothetical protein
MDSRISSNRALDYGFVHLGVFRVIDQIECPRSETLIGSGPNRLPCKTQV